MFAACQQDDRIVAAFLGGSYVTGTADDYSDLDLYLLTTDIVLQRINQSLSDLLPIEPLSLLDRRYILQLE